jgi:hypothetical protein
MSEVNSRQYWELRFATDWQERGGDEQSRFFARLALDLMPAWLLDLLRAQRPTFCDWGCARGHGTATLAAGLPGVPVTGVDFAEPAIATARELHSGIDFRCGDFLDPAIEPGRFDVIFSSNTLEHFADPWRVVARLAELAGRFMVHLVPFREPAERREPEHLSAFDWGDLPLAPLPGWLLVHAAVADAGRIEPRYWNGDQLLVVMCRAPELAHLPLTLADLRIESPVVRAAGVFPDPEAESLRRRLAEAASRCDELAASCRDLGARLDAAVAAREATAADLAATAAERDRTLAERDRLAAEHDRVARDAARLRAHLAEVTAAGERLAAGLAASIRGAAVAGAARPASPDDVVQAMEAAGRRLQELRSRLDAIYGSRSWRWTAPLRHALGGSAVNGD